MCWHQAKGSVLADGWVSWEAGRVGTVVLVPVPVFTANAAVSGRC
jgi:hypothetical protein